MRTYEEAIKHLAELYKAAVGGKLYSDYKPGGEQMAPSLPNKFWARGEEYKHVARGPIFLYCDFLEFDKERYAVQQEFGIDDWYKPMKDTLDYIYGRKTF